MSKFYTIESSNAWGNSTFMTKAFTWTFRKKEAKLFDSLASAQADAATFKLGHIECYSEEYLHMFR